MFWGRLSRRFRCLSSLFALILPRGGDREVDLDARYIIIIFRRSYESYIFFVSPEPHAAASSSEAPLSKLEQHDLIALEAK